MFKSMKTGVLAAILMSTAIFANAQKKVSEGSLIYTAEYLPAAGQEAMVAMLPKESKTEFSGDLSKIILQQGPATITILQNFVSHEGLLLIDVPVAQMQFAVKQTKADYQKAIEAMPVFSAFEASGEKKLIGTYQSEKYTYKDDKGQVYELWTTNDIELPAGFYGEQFKDVKGTLVKYTTFQQGMKINLSLKSLSEGKVGALSLNIPSGYEIKTMEEIAAMQGGGE